MNLIPDFNLASNRSILFRNLFGVSLGKEDRSETDLQNYLNFGEEFRLANRFPQQEAVLKTIDRMVFGQFLVETANGCEEYD
jgi:hypothetical protein